MTVNKSTTLSSRVIAPKLLRLGDQPWAWVALDDLREILNETADAIWWRYCNEARIAMLTGDWEGQSWKFALSNGAEYEIKDVWDMNAGNFAAVLATATGKILIPAGWSSSKIKAADRFEKALRNIFSRISERWTTAREVKQITAPQAVWDGLTEIEKAIKSIGTLPTLDLVLAQLQSEARGLIVYASNDLKIKRIRLSIWDRKRKRTHDVSLEIQIGVDVGSLKLQEMHAWVRNTDW